MDEFDVGIAQLPEPVRDVLLAYAGGGLPAGIAFIRLVMETVSAADLDLTLQAATAGAGGRSSRPFLRERLDELRSIAGAHPEAWTTVRSILRAVAHDTPATDAATAVENCAVAFDRAARMSPEASVALYSLGSAERLDAATKDVCDRLREWGILGKDRILLEIGCGIGRFQAALAGEVGQMFGIDIAPGMVEIARQRCAGLPNVHIRGSSGLNLFGFSAASLDCVFAVDTFPYIVQAGMDLTETHFREAARVLRPAGDLLILNFSYRGDREADASDVARLASIAGFNAMRPPDCPFRLWDGVAFHLKKPG